MTAHEDPVFPRLLLDSAARGSLPRLRMHRKGPLAAILREWDMQF